MQDLLTICLGKMKDQIGEYVVGQIKKALLGEEDTSLADIKKMLEGLQVAINGLPATVVKYLNDQKYVETISLADHNVQEGNIPALLNFLDDSTANGYWGLSNSLAISMTGVSIHEMENNRSTPEKINFSQKSQSYMNTVKNTVLSEIILMTDYVSIITRHAIALPTTIVTVQQTATKALKKISEVKSGEQYYEDCQVIINKAATKKYLPVVAQQGKWQGLSYVLNPALNQAPRDVIGVDLAAVFERATGDGSPWLAISSHRFKDREYRYLQWDNEKNPWFSNNSQKNWYFKFNDDKSDEITINHPKGYLLIGLPDPNKYYPDREKISADYGVWVKNYKVSWHWYVVMQDSKTVHIFGVATQGPSISARYLSTKNRFFESYSYVLDGRRQNDSDSRWVLEVNGF